MQGGSGALGDVFTFEVEGVHRSTQRVTAFEPGRLLEWTVEEAWLSFVARPDEWRGSRIRFELAPLADGRTELTFTHLGLTPAVECFEACSGGWMFYVAGSLRRLATEGEGEPHRAETGLREFEHDLLDAHGAG